MIVWFNLLTSWVETFIYLLNQYFLITPWTFHAWFFVWGQRMSLGTMNGSHIFNEQNVSRASLKFSTTSISEAWRLEPCYNVWCVVYIVYWPTLTFCMGSTLTDIWSRFVYYTRTWSILYECFMTRGKRRLFDKLGDFVVSSNPAAQNF